MKKAPIVPRQNGEDGPAGVLVVVQQQESGGGSVTSCFPWLCGVLCICVVGKGRAICVSLRVFVGCGFVVCVCVCILCVCMHDALCLCGGGCSIGWPEPVCAGSGERKKKPASKANVEEDLPQMQRGD